MRRDEAGPWDESSVMLNVTTFVLPDVQVNDGSDPFGADNDIGGAYVGGGE